MHLHVPMQNSLSQGYQSWVGSAVLVHFMHILCIIIIMVMLRANMKLMRHFEGLLSWHHVMEIPT